MGKSNLKTRQNITFHVVADGQEYILIKINLKKTQKKTKTKQNTQINKQSQPNIGLD